MQIMIDIPERLYDVVRDDLKFDTGTQVDRAIANGIVIPKGHGRLIDADNLSKDEYLESRYGTDFYWEFRRRVDKQPTIIEADDAESEVEK